MQGGGKPGAFGNKRPAGQGQETLWLWAAASKQRLVGADWWLRMVPLPLLPVIPAARPYLRRAQPFSPTGW